MQCDYNVNTPFQLLVNFPLTNHRSDSFAKRLEARRSLLTGYGAESKLNHPREPVLPVLEVLMLA